MTAFCCHEVTIQVENLTDAPLFVKINTVSFVLCLSFNFVNVLYKMRQVITS